MFVYAVTSHKGGVGRTTAAATLGAAFVHLARSVLLVDLDPQSSLTAIMRPGPGRVTVEDVLDDPREISRAIVPCVGGMHIVPARATLATKLQALACARESNLCITHALERVARRYDTVLID